MPWHVASSFTYGPSDHHYQCLSVLEVRPPPLIELPSVYEISFYHALLTRSSKTEAMGWLCQKIMQIVCARFATRNVLAVNLNGMTDMVSSSSCYHCFCPRIYARTTTCDRLTTEEVEATQRRRPKSRINLCSSLSL